MKITRNLDWPAASAAIAEGKRVRRADWITWVKAVNGRLTFMLPKDWAEGRRYRPTAVDMSSNDWEMTGG